MKKNAQVQSLLCPNCGIYNSGLSSDGITKMVCPRCGTTMVRRRKARRCVVVECYPPQRGVHPEFTGGILFPRTAETTGPDAGI